MNSLYPARPLFILSLVILCAGVLLAQNPVPLINTPLVPASVTPGGPDFTLTVNGVGFVSTSVVNWNGTPRSTTFVSNKQLHATVTATDIASATTADVTVVSPGSPVSNSAWLSVRPPTAVSGFAQFTVSFNSAPGNVVAADFNHDGILDVATATGFSGNTMHVMLGHGDSTFDSGLTYTDNGGSGGIVTGDFNDDGNTDIAVSIYSAGTGNTISVFAGNGDGTFQAAQSYVTGLGPFGLVTADFNGDGKLDLATANPFAGTVSVLLGNGDGTFQGHADYSSGISPTNLAVGDFNGDGVLDLVTNNANYVSTLTMLPGLGDGTFAPTVTIPAGPWPEGITAADWNGDSALDLALSNLTGTFPSFTVMLNSGSGTFSNLSNSISEAASTINAGDYNSDGTLDLMFQTNIEGLQYFAGNGDGTFQAEQDFLPGISAATSLFTADVNRDGAPDVLWANGSELLLFLQEAVGPAMLVTPTGLTFATQLINTQSVSQAITLTNIGNQRLVLTGTTVSGDFVLTKALQCANIPPGQSCNLNIAFRPTSPGTRAGTLTITDNAPNSPQTIPLTGTGTVVSLSSTFSDFGSVPLGQTSTPITVTMINKSLKKALSITHISIGGTDFNDFAQTNTCGTSLAAGASCNLTITFTPLRRGSRKATLSIVDNGGGSPQTVALSGTGT